MRYLVPSLGVPGFYPLLQCKSKGVNFDQNSPIENDIQLEKKYDYFQTQILLIPAPMESRVELPSRPPLSEAPYCYATCYPNLGLFYVAYVLV